jgi:hypothetical protein
MNRTYHTENNGPIRKVPIDVGKYSGTFKDNLPYMVPCVIVGAMVVISLVVVVVLAFAG